MVQIIVNKSEEGKSGSYQVKVTEGSSHKNYRVQVPEGLYQKLTGGKISQEDCVKASFRFLLDRESKESILSSFELPVISQYFPEFEREFKNYY